MVEWLLPGYEGLGGLGGGPRSRASVGIFTPTSLLTSRPLPVGTYFYDLFTALLHSVLEVANFFHQVLFELFLIHSSHLLLVTHLRLFLQICSFRSSRLAGTLARHFLLLLEVGEGLIHVLVRAFWGIDLLDKVRKSLDVLAGWVMHAFCLFASHFFVEQYVATTLHFLAYAEDLSVVRAKLKNGLRWHVFWQLTLRLSDLFFRNQILNVVYGRERAFLAILRTTLAAIVAVGTLFIK